MKADDVGADHIQEASEAQVDLSVDDPDTISRVLLYLYTKDYSYELPKGIGFARPDHDATPSTETAATIPETQMGPKPAPKLQSRNIPTGRLFGAPKPQLSEAEVQKRLEAHVAVYVCADRFGIVCLKQKACQYFMELAFGAGNAYCNKPFFSKVLRYIYENTMVESTSTQEKLTDRRGLREEVTVRLLLLQKSSFDNVSLIKEFEPMAYAIAMAKNTEIADVKEDYTTTTNELDAFRSQVTAAEQSKANLKAKIAELESEISKKAEKKINVCTAIRNHKRTQDKLMNRLTAWLRYVQKCRQCRTIINSGWTICVAPGGQNVEVTCPVCGTITDI